MARIKVREKSKIFRMTDEEVGWLDAIRELWEKEKGLELFTEPVTATLVVVRLIRREYERLDAQAQAERLGRQKKKARKKKQAAA